MADKTITQLASLSSSSVDNNDELLIWNTEDGTTRKVGFDSFVSKAKEGVQGYYALLTNYYFAGGVPTTTEITVDDLDEWVDVNFTTDAQGLFDNRPVIMQESITDPFNDATGYFSLEGLTLQSYVTFRASMAFEPDEDEGQLEARLNFQRHSGTTPSEDFQITDVALAMSQGADLVYPAEPTLTFFVGDTIDTNGPGDAGNCKFQVKSSVPGTVSMFALTWYLQQ